MIDPSSDEGKKLGALYQKDNFMRGAYLVQAIAIEGIIGDIISSSLSNEDSRSSLILNYREFTFDGKSKILNCWNRRIIEVTDADIRERLRNCSGLVRKLMEIRNEVTQSKT